MRNILHVFLQASVAKGQWAAALRSYTLAPAADQTPDCTLLLIEALVKGQQWGMALNYFNERLSPLTSSRGARDVECASKAPASTASCHENDSRGGGAEGGKTVQIEEQMEILRQCEQLLWTHLPPNLVLECPHLRKPIFRVNQKAPSDIVAPPPPLASSSTTTGRHSERDCTDSDIMKIARSPKHRNSWSEALRLFVSDARGPTPPSFQATLQCLVRQGRSAEAEWLVQHCFCAEIPKLKPARRLVGCVAECAARTKSVALSRCVLSHSALSGQLFPSAALDILSVFATPAVAKREWHCVDEWWTSVLRSQSSYSLQTHLKLSSVVGKCIIDGTSGKEWERALSAFKISEAYNVDLALLFKLRLLRIARQWKAALMLFSSRLETEKKEPDPILREAFAVMTAQRAERWIPLPAIAMAERKWQAWNHPDKDKSQ